MTLPEFIERRIMHEPMSGCWIWIGPVNYKSRYGVCHHNGATVGAHRCVYRLLRGPIPNGLQLDHLCRNPQCVNPAHLEPVTGRVNTLRGTNPAARNARAVTCKRGHPFNRRHGRKQARVCSICQADRRRRRGRLYGFHKKDQCACGALKKARSPRCVSCYLQAKRRRIESTP